MRAPKLIATAAGQLAIFASMLQIFTSCHHARLRAPTRRLNRRHPHHRGLPAWLHHCGQSRGCRNDYPDGTCECHSLCGCCRSGRTTVGGAASAAAASTAPAAVVAPVLLMVALPPTCSCCRLLLLLLLLLPAAQHLHHPCRPVRLADRGRQGPDSGRRSSFC